jgi:predicted DNA-binding transcriptional regulator AlpA
VLLNQDHDVWLSPREAALLVGMSRDHLARLRCEGGGPPFAKPSARVVRYRRSDVDAWLADHMRQSTFDDRKPEQMGGAA